MPTALPPGPPGHWLLGSLRDFGRERLGFFVRVARDFGDVTTFRLGPKRMLLVNRPELIEQVLVTDAKHYIKHFGTRVYTPVLGNGLVTSEGDFWLRQRRLSQPAFHRQRLMRYSEEMTRLAVAMGERWSAGTRCNVHDEFSALTSQIALKTLFDLEQEGDRETFVVTLREVFDLLSLRFQRLLPRPLWLPTPTNRRLRRGLRVLDGVIQGYIDKARARKEPGNDLLSVLVRATDTDGSSMTDQQLRDEAMTLYLAGHETTALALTWTWFLLATHPDVEEELLAEWARVLGGRPATIEDMPNLELTGRVIQESMRVYPPVYVIGREATREMELGGYRVKRGWTVFLSQWVTHHDERWFPNPWAFKPERWANGAAEQVPKYAYFPFGGGPRVCIGAEFSRIEAVLILATLGQRWRFTVESSTPPEVWPTITLLPKDGLWATLAKR